MLLCPVRCYSCGREVCAKHATYREKLRGGLTKLEALDAAGARSVCCRRMLLSQPTHHALASQGASRPCELRSDPSSELPQTDPKGKGDNEAKQKKCADSQYSRGSSATGGAAG
jgi:DNA-directed RNA polymerase subunit N (RpoN/RPB10)